MKQARLTKGWRFGPNSRSFDMYIAFTPAELASRPLWSHVGAAHSRSFAFFDSDSPAREYKLPQF